MIDRIIAFSIRRRWVVVALSIFLAVWGIRSAYRTPVDAIPDLSEHQVIVFTEWPGHGPREIEDFVSYPLSLELKGMDGVRVVRSSSDVGFSLISVIFEDRISWEAARRQVGNVLDRSTPRWPSGVTPRLAPDASATGQIFWYTVEGKGFDPGRLRAIQDWYVRPQLGAVEGVAEVASVGGRSIEYHVLLDPHRLRARSVEAGTVADAIRRANTSVGGNVIHLGNAEFVVRGGGWLGARPGMAESRPDPQQIIRDLENVTVAGANAAAVSIAEVATVTLGSGPRRGILEKDGGEATGGVVMMKHGENPLAVTRRLRKKIQEIQPGLPPGVRIVPVYDRTPLIEGTIGTVTGTLLEAILTATVCIVIVLRHLRTAFVVAITLPLAVFFSFGLADLLRQSGLVSVETNLMSLAGLAISIGVLVDSSIVMAENAMHRLKTQFGDVPVSGDTRIVVLAACREVGRPIFFSVLIMLLSFLPVFALGGLEGKMFHPLAYTKSFALVGVGLLSILLVPALCTFFVRGRLKSEDDVALVRGIASVYRPMLAYLLDRPVVVVWIVGLTIVLGVAPLGHGTLLRTVTILIALAVAWMSTSSASRLIAPLTILLAGIAAGLWMTPLPRIFLTPLDEGMAMDMPITVPSMSSTQAADDLLARDMILCRFPEVEMVVGKAGRAETATDPAPLDMIETMIGFRPKEFWPRRCLRPTDAERQARAVLDELVARDILREPGDRSNVANTAAMEAVTRFDAQMREAAFQQVKEFERELGRRQVRFVVERIIDRLVAARAIGSGSDSAPLVDSVLSGHISHLGMEPTPEAVAAVARDTIAALHQRNAIAADADLGLLAMGPVSRGRNVLRVLLGVDEETFIGDLTDDVRQNHRNQWRAFSVNLNASLLDRAAGVYTRIVLESLLGTGEILSPRVAAAVHEWQRIRTTPPAVKSHHQGGGSLPFLDPVPEVDMIQSRLTERMARTLLLWPRDRVELAGFGGEMDRAVQMPGWTNVWTMPIQNRVDMLATGVNTTIGVRVLGHRLDDVVRASEEIAAVLKTIRGAADVISDPVRGKGYLEVVPDRERIARHGADAAAVTDLIEIAVGGRIATETVEGRERHPVRVRYGRSFCEDVEAIRSLPVRVVTENGSSHMPLSVVADVRMTEGPAAIKSENGLLRNYVRLNVRGRDATEFVEAARTALASRIRLPDGVHVEWTGQFEHEARARRTLVVAIPAVIVLIALILWWTYRDLADAGLMLLAVPGALAGGIFLQWLLGYPLSVSSWVGSIACFGMATSTGIIMLVYLRQAVANADAMGVMTPDRLRQAVLDGATQRLRPKLLTEATTLFGLAPLLLATGTGSDVLQPMIVPVIGGLLIADEVIDLFLPVLFYRIRLRRINRLSCPIRA